MSKELDLSIDEILNQNNTVSYKDVDKKNQGKKRKKMLVKPVSIYMTEEENQFVEEYCEENFISKNNFFRQLLRQKMQK